MTTFRTVGAHTFTTYRYGLFFQEAGPVTDQTPVVAFRLIFLSEPSRSRDTLCAVGAQTASVGRPLWKVGPR